MGRTIGRMSSSRKQPRSESFARKKVSKSPNKSVSVSIAACCTLPNMLAFMAHGESNLLSLLLKRAIRLQSRRYSLL